MDMKKGEILPLNNVGMSYSNRETRIDLGGSFPLEKLVIDKKIDTIQSISYCLIKNDYTEVTPELIKTNGNQVDVYLNNEQIRYVKIQTADRIEVEELELHVGSGVAAIPNEEWTDLFYRKNGWTGADGLYSVPLDGVDKAIKSETRKSVFVFGDTFIGKVDPETHNRVGSTMVNNTIGTLKGVEPLEDNIAFHWKEGEDGTPQSFFLPTTDKGKRIDGSYYWLQDGVVIQDRFYCMPMIIAHNPDGPEGFEFDVHGITCVSTGIKDGKLDKETEEQIDTPLYFQSDDGKTTYFGAAFMQTEEEEESVYIYGLQNGEHTELVVAKVNKQDFTDYSKWLFWDGKEWTNRKESVKPIANETSSELSVSYMSTGPFKGKYVMVFLEWSGKNRLSLFVGDSPVGPFKDPLRLHYCDEPERGEGVYSYNAKAHPHLSKENELLVSYNVNTAQWDVHEKDGTIYRPRFVTFKFID